jgi:undecaprenyl-diphosphatase
MEIINNLNLFLFGTIFGWSGRYVFLDFLGIFLADYLAYVLVLLLLVFAIFEIKDKFRYRETFFLALGLGLFVRYLAKPAILLSYEKARPFVALDLVPLISTPIGENFESFPSGHALFFFALAIVVYWRHKNLGLGFFVGATLMGLARVYVGVHYPIDILAGATLGCTVGWIVCFIYDKSILKTKG